MIVTSTSGTAMFYRGSNKFLAKGPGMQGSQRMVNVRKAFPAVSCKINKEKKLLNKKIRSHVLYIACFSDVR